MAILATKRTTIHPVCHADARPISDYYLRNAAHLDAWEPLRPDGFHTIEAWHTRAADQANAAAAGTSYHYCIRLTDQSEILALCNFSNVVRGAFQACHLGYSIDQQHEGQGLMFEALCALIPAVLAQTGLHRIMANYVPRNARSGHLLARLGFDKEGLARDYLRIAGRWEDHILTSLIADGPALPHPRG